MKPIISPYELELALQPEPQWTGKYVLDFNDILSSAGHDDAREVTSDADAKEGTEDGDDEKPMFSLITGTYRHPKRYGVETGESLSLSSYFFFLRRNPV